MSCVRLTQTRHFYLVVVFVTYGALLFWSGVGDRPQVQKKSRDHVPFIEELSSLSATLPVLTYVPVWIMPNLPQSKLCHVTIY
jgi:hypothetical protein